MLVLQGYTASYLYLDDAVFYIFTATAEWRFSTSFEYVVHIQLFSFFFLYLSNATTGPQQINWAKQLTSTNMSTQHTTDTSMHQSVNSNQYVNSTHNQHVNASVSTRQPTCRLSTQPTRQCISQYMSTNMSIQHANQHANASVSKRQPTCRLNTSANTSMHHLTATNMSTQHTNQQVNASVSKRQPTCRSNT